MTEIKRYFTEHVMFNMREHEAGEYVRHDDHDAEIATLRANNARLRDALAHIMSRYEEGTIAYWKAKEALK